jgi:hypothetical protein
MDTTEIPIRTTYTIQPPRYPSANDKEKSDVVDYRANGTHDGDE